MHAYFKAETYLKRPVYIQTSFFKYFFEVDLIFYNKIIDF